MLVLFLQLFIAHLIGDFLLQPDKWVADKEAKKIRSKYLYWHILIHTVALLLLLPFRNDFLWTIAIIVASHYLIDLAKLYAQDLIAKHYLFILDQVAHLLVLVAVVYYFHPFVPDLNFISEPQNLLMLSAVLLSTVGAATLMKLIMAYWSLDEDETDNSLPKAGYYIGILERLFVFIFVVLQQWQGIGFIIAAKSVFRFGDLTRASDRQLTEYILIGTLLSFGLAIIIGLLYNSLLTSF